jgi:hypothetical protein
VAVVVVEPAGLMMMVGLREETVCPVILVELAICLLILGIQYPMPEATGVPAGRGPGIRVALELLVK